MSDWLEQRKVEAKLKEAKRIDSKGKGTFSTLTGSMKSLLASSALCESTERSQAAAMLQARVRGTKARKGYEARKGW